MKALIKTPVLKIIVLFLLVNTITSCVYYEEPHPSSGADGYNGKAYVSLYWDSREPDYVDADGIVPQNFYWNTYYYASPGFYTIHYEYDYNNGRNIVTYAYDADVEVWVNYGERGGRGYNGRDGADNYFDLVLVPDGWFDYTVSSSLKSDTESDSVFIKNSGYVDSTIVNKGGYSLKIKYRKSTPRDRNL